MDSVSQVLRQTRTQLGLTQTELSHASGVSLPTIQNIEAGKGNPSFSTLEELLAPLGMKIEFSAQPADWDTLAACGAPLLQLKSVRVKPNAELLITLTRSACLELQTRSDIQDVERKREALSALLWTIHHHFPTFYGRWFDHELFNSYLPQEITGRMIKLKRQTVAVLATYL